MWKVLMKGDIYDPDRNFELSVIKTNNKHGLASWGWGGPDKIVLFNNSIGGNHLNPRTKDRIEFALSVADKLCGTLNSSG